MPSSITYSNVMLRAFCLFTYCQQASSSSAIGCLRLIGTSSSRSAIVRRVQRNGQRAVGLLGEPQHLRHEARRADRDATARDVEAEIVHQDLGGGHDVAIVRERLAHAHEHDVRDRRGRRPAA